jgi:hypothetical protein
MSTPFIANEFQYRAVRTRITALDEHLCALADLLCLAGANRALIKIEDEDLHDLAPLDDAICDITWTRERLLDAADEWEELVEYGKQRMASAPRVISIKS